MLLRVQFAGETFTRILRRGFARQNLCDAAVLEMAAPGTGVKTKGLAFIDHIEIVDDPPLPFEVGPPRTFALSGTPLTHPELHFAQKVKLVITTLIDLRNAINAVPTLHTIELTLVFRLALEMHYSQRSLTLTHVATRNVKIGDSLKHLTQSLGQPLQESAVEEMLASALAEPVAQPLGFLSKLAVLDLPPVAHMGIAGSPGFGSIEMRFDLREGGQAGIDFGSWSAFHNQTGVDDLRAGRNWALLIDKDILVQRGLRMFDQGLVEAEKKNSFRRRAAPTATWNATPPRIDLSCLGIAPDALDCLGEDVDVPITVKVSSQLDVAQKEIGGHMRTVLRADVNASHEANPSEIAALCHAVTHAIEFDNVLDRLEALFDGSVFADLVDWLQGTSPVFPIGVAVLFGPVGLLFLCVVDVVAFALEGDDSSTLRDELAGCEIPDPSNLDVQVCYMQLSVEPGPGADYGLTLDQARGRADGLVLAGNVAVGGLARPQVEVTSSAFTWIEPAKACDGPIAWSANATITVKQTTGDWPVTVCPVFPDTFAHPQLPAGKDYGKYVRASVVADHPREVELAIAIPPYEIHQPAVCFRTFVVTSAGVRLVWIPFPPALDPAVAREKEFWIQVWRVNYCETLVDDWTRYFQKYNPRWSVDPPPYENPYAERRLWVVLGERFRALDRVLAWDGERRLVEAHADRHGRLSFGVFVDGDELTLERQPVLATAGRVALGYRNRGALRGTQLDARDAVDVDSVGDDRRPALTVHQLQLLEYARVPATLDVMRIDGEVASRGVRFVVQGRGGAHSVEIDRHGVVSQRRLRGELALQLPQQSFAAPGVVRDARAAMLGLAATQLEVLRDEGRKFRSAASGGVELAASYTGTPWCYRSAQAGDWFAQLDDATATLGLFRVAGRVTFPVRETHRADRVATR